MASVFGNILEQIESQIRQYVDLTGEGSYPEIKAESVVIRYPQPKAGDDEEHLRDEVTPGVLIVPGRSVRIPPDEGDNCHDMVYYPVSIQVIDTEDSRIPGDQMASWLKWAEKLRKFFNQNNLRKEQWEPAGFVSLAIVPMQDPFDDRLFSIHRLCVQTTAFEVQSLEDRDPQGRV
ncbi:hypothetical protein [Planctomicrobium piriforme]|uniref:Uncharacterized protein n=1 Tax=Planctomicrobium piriforme TaxID=1576369 RepID=A0A1I3EC71_9PLAN|nr:hypothetical protein [Planctomicrobium piriforme]SFH96518.1 hypothetical protein SAMN05421753_104159 [Planctomicrobium piriforme]